MKLILSSIILIKFSMSIKTNLLIFATVLIFQILFGENLYGKDDTQEKAFSIILKKDSLSGTSKLLLFINGRLTDSAEIDRVNQHSLSIINDTLWRYRYEVIQPEIKDLTHVKELLIGENNLKIHTYYAYDYQRFILPPTDQKEIDYGYFFFRQYDSSIDENGLTVVLTRYAEDYYEGIESCKNEEKLVKLEYDQKEMIYYNTSYMLNGEFFFYPLEKDQKNKEVRKVWLQSTEVKGIKIDTVFIVYYNGYWFRVTGADYTGLTPFSNFVKQ